MDRQGLSISINELKDLINELETQKRELVCKEDIFIDDDKKWQINIINKTPQCSDTWEIE